MATPASSSSIHNNVVPSEVGWQFVPQYYTFVNKQPNRLHCFYTKSSTFVHGVEGEECKPCYGQQEIHNKITSIGFQDCKVFIHSVDAQSSANGGIIIQVIGEMSNHSDQWRKFVQTFFLAEQPNGYFVLNDIFRFLKEDTIESDEASDADAAAPDSVPPQAVEPIVEPPSAPYEPEAPHPAAPSPATAAPAEEIVPPVAPDLVVVPIPAHEPEAQLNGVHLPEQPTPEPAAPASDQPEAQLHPSPAPAEIPQLPPPTTAPPPPPAQLAPAPPNPPAPAAPKTWANLAAQNPRRWGSAVAQESRGTTEIPVTSVSAAPAASSGQHGHASGGGRGGQHGSKEHPAYVAAHSVSTPQVFVKGVTEPVSLSLLTQALTSRFGSIKDIEIVRTRACAFLEFATLESAKKAIIASLPQSSGGEGGIWIDVAGDAGQVKILVETKKERGERPVGRSRGGAPMNGGESRGGSRGGRTGFGSGRGRSGGGGGGGPLAQAPSGGKSG